MITAQIYLSIGLLLVGTTKSASTNLRSRSLEADEPIATTSILADLPSTDPQGNSRSGIFAVLELYDNPYFDNPNDYLHARLLLGEAAQQFDESQFDEYLIDTSTDNKVSLFDETIDADNGEAVAAGSIMIDEFLPLLEGETEIETSLATSYNDDYESEIHVIQETSIAKTAVYMGLERDEIVDESDDGSVVFPDQDDTEGMFTSVALALANALANEAGAFIWGRIESELFPDGNLPSYYGQVFAEMRKIVKDELSDKEKKDVEALAKLFNKAMNSYTYFGKKEIDLRQAETYAEQLITKSESTSYLGDKGAFLYAEGIVYHIMILQEKYKREFVDPSTNIADESSEKGQATRDYISRRAQTGIDELNKMYKSLVDKRMSLITGEYQWWTAFASYGQGRTIGGVREGVYFQACWLGAGRIVCRPKPERSCYNHWECRDSRRGKDFPDSFPLWAFEDKFNDFWLTMENKVLNQIPLGRDYSWNFVHERRTTYYNNVKWDIEHNKLNVLSGVAAQLQKIVQNPVPGL